METVYVEGSGDVQSPTLDFWLRDILVHTPGAERKVVRRELQLTIREFYERSAAWRATIGPIATIQGKQSYWLSPYDAYTDVTRIIAVSHNGIPMRKLPAKPHNNAERGESPWAWWAQHPDTISLYPIPDAVEPGELLVQVALIPKITVKNMPPIAASHHYDALLDGVLGRLMLHPAKPYTNPLMGEYHMKRFRSAIGAYAADAKQGYSNAPNWTFPRFGV